MLNKLYAQFSAWVIGVLAVALALLGAYLRITYLKEKSKKLETQVHIQNNYVKRVERTQKRAQKEINRAKRQLKTDLEQAKKRKVRDHFESQ